MKSENLSKLIFGLKMQQNNESFIVLRNCRNLLKILKITDKNGIYLNGLFYFIYLLPLNLVLTLCIWFCFDNNFNLTAIVWPMNLTAGVVQMELIYFCLISKRNLLNEMMVRLQFLINQSTCVMKVFKTLNICSLIYCYCYMYIFI